MNEFYDKSPLEKIESRHEPVPWMTENIREIMNKRVFVSHIGSTDKTVNNQ